ncbi:MAG: phytanoyl-CoA dioxygenase family protein, partial [Planctomycetes bacterium]|nr:phytanoyl-CoA dioxygenase family protein [Planctomycetota bacterium]
MRRVEEDGFAVLPDLLAPGEVDAVLRELEAGLGDPAREGAISTQAGQVYAARNVLSLWPGAADVWRAPPLLEILTTLLGPRFGLVRALFFDKPPQQTWALPWHKDLTIAVRDNRLPSEHFRKPTRKAGVPHAEAPEEVLHSMLTVRLHLDAATQEIGPLK